MQTVKINVAIQQHAHIPCRVDGRVLLPHNTRHQIRLWIDFGHPAFYRR